MKRLAFIDKLTILLSQLDFDEEAKVDALNYISSHYPFISKAANEAYVSENDDDPILKRKPHTRLMILIYKIVSLKDTYDENKWPQDVLFDTLSDVTLRQRMYFKRYGKLGLSDEDATWLKHIYQRNIFKLGSLQFEIAYMKYLTWKGLVYSKEFSKKLPEGVPILNIHIRAGVALSRDAVDQSFEKAESFFQKYFPHHDFVAYICNSWMLYPGNREVLSTDSNILVFSNRFEIIGESHVNDMAIKYIFGKRYRKREDFPQETSLQKNALKNIRRLGVGCGVIWRNDAIGYNFH